MPILASDFLLLWLAHGGVCFGMKVAAWGQQPSMLGLLEQAIPGLLGLNWEM